ncbi:hypothetical protein CO058_02455 [candidate division WWE3 bacterium CG_4_9_14_0_2_um_filter_35_11]|uniref:Carbohydrate kinase PfkB domain-containing protein n=1 Tax=candidate division WWE3 bacterium CG_4_9_14_0_2_um_filter_35_11 TaxID=1975077 RepID=A0A2M8ELI0_UNCKA|nr:MAG: hypothetical protein COV25_02715 [candidate division WWE3 bacterium CG10_big_fil_rev_8_21_14_0_10_35_32]PJC23596.1 MAG: hypothetical protein CO058_02455 [candidate division WWE3 bacterium CG_4_9_14_0_2_um_filter_35_11]
MTAKLSSVHCIGHVTLDTFFELDGADITCDLGSKECKVSFGFGAKVPVKNVRYGVGGGASNVAVGLRKLGIQTYLHSAVGNDPKGIDIKNELDQLGVDLTHLKADGFPTDQSAILSYFKERTIFTYSQDRKISFNVDFAEYIFLSSVGGDVSDLYKQVIMLAKKTPSPILFLNPGSKELKNSRNNILDIINYTDYLICNLEEARMIVDPSLSKTQIEITDLLDILIQKGADNVVLTDGINGSFAHIGGQFLVVPAHEVEVVEKTGAGDAFATGFISGIIHGVSALDAMRRGAVNSAGVITKLGAQNGLLDLSEMESKVRSWS